MYNKEVALDNKKKILVQGTKSETLSKFLYYQIGYVWQQCKVCIFVIFFFFVNAYYNIEKVLALHCASC